MQGQVGVLLIIIIAIGVLFLFFGQGLLTHSQTGSLTYSNDLISIEDVFISNSYPRPGEKIDMKVKIKNNGPKSIKPWFLLLDYQDLNLVKLTYSYRNSIKSCDIFKANEYGKCEINSEGLSPFEFSEIYAEFEVPSNEKIPLVLEGRKEYRIIRYMINYTLSGSKEIFIPITPNINKVPSLRYSESSGDFGPVQIQVEVPSSGKVKVNNKLIELHYGVAGMPLTFSFKFVNIGTQGEYSEFKIKSLSLNYPSDIFSEVWCRGGSLEKEKGKIVFSEIDTETPIDCRFEVKDSISEERVADLKFEYEYMYSFFDHSIIEIQPKITSI